MSKLWNCSRQLLSGGSPFARRVSFTTRLPRPLSSPSTCLRPCLLAQQTRRGLLTLAIETSCDDTCVAVLEKSEDGVAHLHFNEKITSDSSSYGGVHPVVAVTSHSQNLAPLVQKALRVLPKATHVGSPQEGKGDSKILWVDGDPRLKPDFISVTRGPGMTSNLATGLNLAKGLAVAWDVPLLGVNHMQAHALTPRLVGALEEQQARQYGDWTSLGIGDDTWDKIESGKPKSPQFPFLSLLVSGGHTMLVRSEAVNEHHIIADALNIAAGDMIDKCARLIVPPEIISAELAAVGMHGPILEEFAFPDSTHSANYDYDYTPPVSRGDEIKIFEMETGSLTPPLSLGGQSKEAASTYEFAGLNGQVQKMMMDHPDMDEDLRRMIARGVMTLVFEHLTSRVLFALQAEKEKLKMKKSIKKRSGKKKSNADAEGPSGMKTIVLSGGVASNRYLRHVMRKILDARSYGDVEVVAPPVSLCTDNAAMIAWTGMEMYELGWRSGLGIMVLRKWPLDPKDEDGGILEVEGWHHLSAKPETVHIENIINMGRV
ncbi:glycoprotease family-domain-containing protein [Ustulina deusta]|nr:glycoprotease family-domain-containing protein [Ustulina deusta]